MHESELIGLIKRRDEKGAALLLRHYAPLMRYIIAPILQNEQDREECVSEAAMRVWDRIEQFDPSRGSWNAWLTALTRNAALDKARKNKCVVPSEDVPNEAPSSEPTPITKVSPRSNCCVPFLASQHQRTTSTAAKWPMSITTTTMCNASHSIAKKMWWLRRKCF